MAGFISTWNIRKVFRLVLRSFNLKLSEQTVLIIVAALIGVVVGLGTVFFERMLEGSSWLFGTFLPRLVGGHLWIVALMPALGGLLLAPFFWKWPEEAQIEGIPATMEAVAFKNGAIKWTSGLFTMLISSLTLGSGGSAGSEGPIVRIGSAFGSGVGQLFGVEGPSGRLMAACGAGAGLAAIFNAPIAGVLFAIEVVLGEFHVYSFSPIVISAVVATALSRAFLFHGEFALQIPAYQLFSPWEIGLYAILGIAAGFVSAGFVRLMQVSHSFFHHKVKIPTVYKPALGGLLVGIMGVWLPQVLGFAHGPYLAAINGKFSLGLLFILLAAKIVATALTLGSGGCGGVLCPSLFMGAALGSGLGMIFHDFLPHMIPQAGGYGIVGMGAVLGAVVQAPMAAIVMIFEMINDYTVILPMMTACILAAVIQKSILKGSIYTLNLSGRGIDIHAGREMGVLSNVRVRDVMEPVFVAVPSSASYDVVLQKCLNNGGNCLYVLDEKESLAGVVSFADLKEYMQGESEDNSLRAADISNSHFVFVTPDESLASSLNKFNSCDLEQLPVIDPDAGKNGKIRGVITRGQLLKAYREEMLKRQLIPN
ncbi:MAG: chloride channel protein [Syntrophobacteraceae bacterium]